MGLGRDNLSGPLVLKGNMKKLFLGTVVGIGLFAGTLPAFATVTVTADFIINQPCVNRVIGPDGDGNTWTQTSVPVHKCHVVVTHDDSAD